MFLRHTTDDENNVGTWAHEHGFYSRGAHA